MCCRCRFPGPRAAGFTLIELMITVTVVALLASVALPLAEVAVQRSKEQELRMALRQIREALDAYRQAGDEGRILRKPGDSGYPKSLQILVEGGNDAKDPSGGKIYFLRHVPRDPFFKEASAPAEQTWGKRSYASPADDPREGEDIFDIYSLSPGIGLNGVAYRDW